MTASTPTSPRIDSAGEKSRRSTQAGTAAGDVLSYTSAVPPAAEPARSDARRDACDFSNQVSFIIQHTVKPEHRDQYEAWLHKIIAEAGTFKGHMGAHVVRPTKGENLYEISVRFASREDAERWMQSEERRALVREAATHFAEPEHLDIKSGLDYWFTAATNGKAPKVWKQWLTTVSVIWPLSMVMPIVMGKLFQWIPPLGTWGVAQLLSAMVMVGLLTWVIMPPYTRAIRKWLSR